MTTRTASFKVPRGGFGIRFRRITESQKDIETLYKLLQERERGISHASMPTMVSHRKFVLNHPYRFWYLIESAGAVLGSLYFHFDNSVGISMPGQSSSLTRTTLEAALGMHRPLKEVKSVRPGIFFVNASPGDQILRRALKDMGWSTLQITYAANSKSLLGGNHV
jgi:hypothetical protein